MYIFSHSYPFFHLHTTATRPPPTSESHLPKQRHKLATMKTFAALALLALQAAAGNVVRQDASIGSLLIHESTDCGSPVVKEVPAQLSTCIPLGGNYTNVDVSALEVSAAATCYSTFNPIPSKLSRRFSEVVVHGDDDYDDEDGRLTVEQRACTRPTPRTATGRPSRGTRPPPASLASTTPSTTPSPRSRSAASSKAVGGQTYPTLGAEECAYVKEILFSLPVALNSHFVKESFLLDLMRMTSLKIRPRKLYIVHSVHISQYMSQGEHHPPVYEARTTSMHQASRPNFNHLSPFHVHTSPHEYLSPPQKGTGTFRSRYPNHRGLLLADPAAASPPARCRSSTALAHLTSSPSAKAVCMMPSPNGIPDSAA